MPLLEIESVQVAYGDLTAVADVSLAVQAGEVMALIGANGAGKTSLLKAVAGLLRPVRGRVRLEGADVTGLPAEQLAQRGVALVPEGRLLFPSLTVHENLLMGGAARRAGPWTPEAVYELFPALAPLRRRNAALLSGGQQQMVAIGRALASNPRVLLCDELSLGLAPAVVEEIYRALPLLRSQQLALVLVEQDVARACAAAARVTCLRNGRVTLQCASADATPAAVARAYFGD